MNDAKTEAADKNAKTAISLAVETQANTEERLQRMEGALANMQFQIADLTRKINLALSERFNGRSTSE